MYGKDFQYASTRIENTIVRISETGEPVYVCAVDNAGGMCTVCNLTEMQGMRVDFGKTSLVSLDDLNVRPVKLGYVNFNAEAFYLERMPIRHGPNNQGLNVENCVSSGPGLYNFPMKEFIRCIKGEYPDFKNAVEKSATKKRNGQSKTIAFDRYWAVFAGNKLLYKNHEVVGVIKNGVPVLSGEYIYLKERLEAAL
jgi:hypothetical protein